MHVFQSRLRPARELFPLGELSRRSAEAFGDRPAMRVLRDKQWKTWSYRDLHCRVTAIAQWLIEWGIQPGDPIAILGENSPEWEATYLGVQAVGGICVPIDRMLPASGIRHILHDSGSRILFADARFLQTVDEVEPVRTLETTVALDCERCNAPLTFVDVVTAGSGKNHPMPALDLNRVAAILYTSGTTGHSKGVMLTSRNILSNAEAAGQLFDTGPGDVFISVLPVHHSFEATAGFIFPIYFGATIAFAPSLAGPEIVAAIRDNGGTYLCGVPLLFEKMQAGILRNVRKAGRAKETVFSTMMGVAALGEKVGLKLGFPLFHGLREKAGLGTMKYFLSAGGPLDPVIGRFFNRFGLRTFQGYGLTETSPCTHLTPAWKIRHECVGPTLPGVECKILEPDALGIGEVCVKGPNVFAGYYKNEKATTACFTEDGWFRTGDLGIVHPDGYLQITGRAKALIVTAGGKNVFPEEIEFYLNRMRFIAESIVVGIKRKFGMGEEVGALIYPDFEQIDLHDEEKGIKSTTEDIRSIVQAEIKKAMKNLADYKRIKTFRIFDSEFQKTTKRTIKRFLYSGEMVEMENSSEQLPSNT
ncbi:MAG: AMP-binding protein [bacterium]